MRQAYDEGKKKSICLEVKNLQDEDKSSLSDILSGICKKYNVGTNEVYTWNKKFGMIFDNNLFSKEEKFQICYIVAELILCNVSIAEAVSFLAQKNGIEKHAIYKWNRELKLFKTSKKYTDEEKKNICRQIAVLADGADNPAFAVRMMAEKYNVSVKSIYTWNQKYKIFPTIDNGRTTPFGREFCIKVLKEVAELGGNVPAIEAVAKKYDISFSAIYAWNRIYKVFMTRTLLLSDKNSR